MYMCGGRVAYFFAVSHLGAVMAGSRAKRATVVNGVALSKHGSVRKWSSSLAVY